MLLRILLLIAVVGIVLGCEDMGETPAEQSSRILRKNLQEGQTGSEMKDCARWDQMKWGEKWSAVDCKQKPRKE